ncbi:hypothetical protein BDZ45DRAFT_699052 [Acephala macrosclerotiorum]|nr:hypothetical protein BDZ45DRAFT_699052 [Acephala macrosclerotiorum]
MTGMRMNIPWSDLNEQPLLAYKKEGKFWEWIFSKFPGTTRPAIRGRAVAQALYAYLSLSICRDEYLKGTLSLCRPVASREQVQSRESSEANMRRIVFMGNN